jgi:hypothetical protein
MNGDGHSLKAKAEGVRLTRPLPILATRPSRFGRGLILSASVAFLIGWRRRSSNQL